MKILRDSTIMAEAVLVAAGELPEPFTSAGVLRHQQAAEVEADYSFTAYLLHKMVVNGKLTATTGRGSGAGKGCCHQYRRTAAFFGPETDERTPREKAWALFKKTGEVAA